MVVLKKIKGSTLMETLVASVLIVVIFMIASMILNNLFSSSIKNNTRQIDAYLSELEYLYRNKKIIVPYEDIFNDWDISIDIQNVKESQNILFEAKHSKTQQTTSKIISEKY